MRSATALLIPFLAVSNAAALPLLPDQVFLDVGGEVYRVDYSGFKTTHRAWIEGSIPCFDVPIKRALFSGSPAVEGFRFATSPSPADMEYIGDSAAAVFATTGIDLDDVQAWEATTSIAVCKDTDGVSLTQVAGEDTVTYDFPWATLIEDLSQLPPSVVVTVTVNGSAVGVAPAYLAQVASMIASTGGVDFAPFSPTMATIATLYNDPSLVNNAFYGYAWKTNLVFNHFDWWSPGPYPQSCVGECLGCAGAIGTMLIGTSVGLIGGCNPATATASVGWSCATAFGAIGAGWVQAIGQCLDCDECLNPPGPPPPGGGGDGCSDPSGCCPQGYHECCNNQCCSDANPPPSCP
jgi:hypothetical protein